MRRTNKDLVDGFIDTDPRKISWSRAVSSQRSWSTRCRTSTTRTSATTIDIEALRRMRIANGLYNQFKDLRTEQYRAIYDKPIYPKNQYLEKPPEEDWLAREDATRAKTIQTLVERGVLTPPSGNGHYGQVISDTVAKTGTPS